jgi:hypothetical protein
MLCDLDERKENTIILRVIQQKQRGGWSVLEGGVEKRYNKMNGSFEPCTRMAIKSLSYTRQNDWNEAVVLALGTLNKFAPNYALFTKVKAEAIGGTVTFCLSYAVSYCTVDLNLRRSLS